MGLRQNESGRNLETVSVLQTAIRLGTPVIIADNVVEFVNEEKIAGRLPSKWSDIPPCPPFCPIFFIEWQYPQFLVPSQTDWSQAGMMFQAYSADDDDEYARARIQFGRQQFPSAHRLYLMWYFAADLQGHPGLLLAYQLLLDKDAVPLSYTKLNFTRAPEANWDLEFNTSLFTLAFIQRSSVAPHDVTTTEGPSPEWCRARNLPELTYHALTLDRKAIESCMKAP